MALQKWPWTKPSDDLEHDMTSEKKRQELRERVEAGERRNEQRAALAEYARGARDNTLGFVKQHPVITIVGGLTVGLVAGALTSRGRKAGRRVGVFTAALAELGTMYVTTLLEKAGEAALASRDKIEDLGDNVEAAARTARREIGHHAGTTADRAATIGKRISRKTGRTVRDLRGRAAR